MAKRWARRAAWRSRPRAPLSARPQARRSRQCLSYSCRAAAASFVPGSFATHARATGDGRGVVLEQRPRVETSMEQAFAEWGLHGVEMLCERVSVLIIVDVLSFSTAVAVAVARGASVIPFPLEDRKAARQAAAAARAVLAEPRSSTTNAGYSLSPQSLATIPSGAKLLLPSPNGSRLSA